GVLADAVEPTYSWRETYIHPDDREEVEAAIDEAIRSKSMFELEHRVLRADGSCGWVASRAAPILDDDGAIVEWLGAGTDITGRRQTEEALRESEARLLAIIESLPVGAGVIDL